MMTLGSLFSGIGGFDLGFKQAGFTVRWQVEIEEYCRQVLAARFPEARRYEDIQECFDLEKVDCIAAGVPCQDVSVAGKRAGLKGERTGLFYEFARILRYLRPTWFVFENVPGLLSSNRGRDFAEVLRVLMVECRYGVSWRVLDSRFFGVAQRRRRLYVVGYSRGPCPATVLFEPARGRRNLAPGEETRPDIAAPLTHGSGVTSNAQGRRREDDFNLIANAISASAGHHGHSSPRGDGSDNLVATINSGGNNGGFRTEPGEHLVAYALRRDPGGIGQGHNTNFLCAPVDSNGVRDFARLPQGLDSARYRALGNAVTVNVAHWIAKRILKATV
jgi:DNA (cytosine-5)-methyltransferase 1